MREKDDEKRVMMMVKMICCIPKKVDDSDLQSTHMGQFLQGGNFGHFVSYFFKK